MKIIKINNDQYNARKNNISLIRQLKTKCQACSEIRKVRYLFVALSWRQ